MSCTSKNTKLDYLFKVVESNTAQRTNVDISYLSILMYGTLVTIPSTTNQLSATDWRRVAIG